MRDTPIFHNNKANETVFLIISELPVFRGYFNRNWPLFGEDSGFVTLAGIMMILGVAVLGNLNIETMSQKSFGLAFWRIVISAGILAMVMSVINVLAVSLPWVPHCLAWALTRDVDIDFHRPQRGRQRPSCPGIWCSGSTEGGESDQ